MKKSIAVIMVCLLLGTILMGCGCSSSNIVGKWKEEQMADYYTIYEFKEDGTGQKLKSKFGKPEKSSFKYKLKGERLIIDNHEYKYTIDGDKLNLHTDDGDVRTYERVN